MKRTLPALLLLLSLLLAACGASPAVEPPTPVSPALTALLNRLSDTVQPGTAGASLRAAAAAADLLDWAGDPPPQESIEATVADWLGASHTMTAEQLMSLRGMVEQLSADYAASAGLLEDAGLSGRGPWSADAAQTALALLERLEQ